MRPCPDAAPRRECALHSSSEARCGVRTGPALRLVATLDSVVHINARSLRRLNSLRSLNYKDISHLHPLGNPDIALKICNLLTRSFCDGTIPRWRIHDRPVEVIMNRITKSVQPY